ncbi:uncharacterized protein K460DRAFT_363226 [Cucurbitaria berberidis CBS 394.84]|uniref:Uncharacterized protein n=1 Tax=Cucurbitaria berberidis CBS 394.84 TaxID=1168544 RepID=A0A9P4GJ26_9PLEO|nr:uncharacterized protein K460DRAFT_363226 [Cucurbitaria berberidis CBS 394.84]KAF1847123.1 hypothetical protein K460DRAFT_363226 [Cucurbitaria berberidis CBS 394.84]
MLQTQVKTPTHDYTTHGLRVKSKTPANRSSLLHATFRHKHANIPSPPTQQRRSAIGSPSFPTNRRKASITPSLHFRGELLNPAEIPRAGPGN